MAEVHQVQTLSDFRKHADEVARRLRQTGETLVLTVDDQEALVVQDAAAYRVLLERLEHAETVAALRRAIDQCDRDEALPAREAFEALRDKHGIPR